MKNYSEHITLLSDQFNLQDARVELNDSGVEIRNCEFRSSFQILDPTSNGDASSDILMPKSSEDNSTFVYSIFSPKAQVKSNNAILLFHGLNERTWDKYLPWAEYLAETTGQAVILFPIAYHMNRSPKLWSDPSFLLKYMKSRGIFESDKSNFANAALSERLMFNPQQFFVSGVQTIFDVVDLIDQVKTGEHPYLEKNTTFNLFGYSIGAFLAQVLVLANPKKYFSKSKLLLFCGGPTFDQMNGISKYIMNKDAFEALRTLFLARNRSDIKRRLYLRNWSKVRKYYDAFLSMIRLENSPRMRERRFKSFSKQVYAICLLKDVVMPAISIMNTLTGRYRNVPIRIDLMDFKYPYSHENPFPILGNGKQRLVDKGFESIFSKAAQFYNG